jgi:hypothetical protein
VFFPAPEGLKLGQEKGLLGGGLGFLLRPWVFSSLLAAVFVLRGIFLLAVLPPFEGWDEYQHLAFIAFLSEQGS